MRIEMRTRASRSRPLASRVDSILPGHFWRAGGHVSAVLVPYHVEQDEDGVWCAEAIISERVGATAYGETRDQALAELRQAVIASFEADG